MRRPDFTRIAYQPPSAAPPAEQAEATWLTPEHIAVRPAYTRADLAQMQHLDYNAGLPPYLRGPYSTMYVMQPLSLIHI